MERQLGAFESALTFSDRHAPLNVVVVLRLEAGPSPAALRRALDAVQARHPLLRARIRTVAGRYVFGPCRDGAIALRLAERDDGEAWVREAEAELETRLDAGAGVPARCAYLEAPASGPGDCEVLLTFHHAFMDGASAVSLVRELLAACGAADAGAEPGLGEPLAPLPAAEDLFPPACQGGRRRARLAGFLLRQLGQEIADRWRARGRWHPPISGPTRNRILSFRLSGAETKALVRRSRRRRLTLHSAFDAALLLAVSRHLYPRQSLPLRHLVFADLRPYLKPPVAAENLGAYFSMLRFCSSIAPESSLWRLAREINARVHAGVRRGEKYLFSLTGAAAMRHLIRSGKERMATTALSYTGAARLAGESRFPVKALHAFVSNFRLGPEYTAQVRLHAGRICWDILYLEPELDEDAARRIACEIRNLLTTAEEPP